MISIQRASRLWKSLPYGARLNSRFFLFFLFGSPRRAFCFCFCFIRVRAR